MCSLQCSEGGEGQRRGGAVEGGGAEEGGAVQRGGGEAWQCYVCVYEDLLLPRQKQTTLR